jgi:hypothetical protein
MEKLAIIPFLFTLLCIGSALAQSPCPMGAHNCSPLQAQDFKSVFEVVKGATDGKNRQYQLSARASAQFPVRIFRNGLELSPGQDFTINNQVITLAPSVIQIAGDVIQASYEVALTPAPSDFRTSTPRTKNAEGAEVLSRFLHRSLVDELGPEPAPTTAGPLSPLPSSQGPRESSKLGRDPISRARSQQSSQSNLPSSNQPPGDFESLRMLSIAISRPYSENRSFKDHRKETHGAQGLEGIGDTGIDSPYSILGSSSNGLDASLDAIDSKRSTGPMMKSTPSPRRQPRSLRLLQQRIEDNQ